MTELTVESLRDARFREGWRGYNPADVDAFIDQISTGVQSLQDRIRELVARAERSESRTIGENDETVKRTLVLAQRAADLVVSEAKLVSERIVSTPIAMLIEFFEKPIRTRISDAKRWRRTLNAITANVWPFSMEHSRPMRRGTVRPETSRIESGRFCRPKLKNSNRRRHRRAIVCALCSRTTS